MKPIETKQEYSDYVDKKSPNSPILKNCFNAFWVGGLICSIGQIILDFCMFKGMDNTMASTVVSISLIAISAILTVLFKGKSGEVYNATNPDTFTTVKDRAYKSFEQFNPKITIEFAETDTSTKEGYLPQRSLLEDITKIKELGWKPLRNM